MLWLKGLMKMTKGTKHGNYVLKKGLKGLLNTKKKLMQIFLMWAWFIYHDSILCIKNI